MALSMKNTLVSLSLSSMMLFAGFLASEQPVSATSRLAVTQELQTTQTSSQNLINAEHAKKTKRAFTTPYFSFKKSSLSVRVR